MLRRRFSAGVVALLAAVFVAHASVGSAAADGCVGATAVPVREGDRAEATRAIRCLVNRVRTSRGLRPVRLSGQLAAAARFHSADMVDHRYFGHVGSAGDNLLARVKRSGYGASNPGFAAAEALAWGTQAAPDVLMRALLLSREHKRILLNPRAGDLGIGLALGAATPGVMDSSATLTLVFGE